MTSQEIINMQDHRSIAFLGAGNMARAIISGLIKANYPASLITAVNRSIEKNVKLEQEFGIKVMTDAKSAAIYADVIVLGVKPQLMSQLLSQLSNIKWQDKLIISIAAGISIKRLTQMTSKNANSIIRVMPNTPALIGQGMSGLFASPKTNQRDCQFATLLMQAVGKTCWVETESQINTVISAAGSAPAYFFFIMQAMQDEAIRQGISPQIARELVAQSAKGAAEMVMENPKINLEDLQTQVTSKGGTTEQAIKVFEHEKLDQILAKAMQAAVKRAEEMETLF